MRHAVRAESAQSQREAEASRAPLSCGWPGSDVATAGRNTVKLVTRRVAALLCGAVSLLALGCAGSGRIELAALNYRDIDPPEPTYTALSIQRCTWWTDEHGQVWIAMQHERAVALAGEKLVFRLSLVLDALPAGRAKNYLVSRRELRAFARFGPAQARYTSLAGIVALYREDGDRLRGSLRLDVAQQAQQLLGGWTREQRHLMLGTFIAVPDDGWGRTLAAETEALGWHRDPPPAATQPAADGPAQRDSSVN